ncbi:uncharacterized protein WCC33_013482 [Rhinophrynus dorsalis]
MEAKAEAELAQDKLSDDTNVSLREDKSILTDSIEDGLHAKLGQESNVEVKVEEVHQNEHFTETEESICGSHENEEKSSSFQTLMHDLDPEEQMEVATQLGSLNFETDSMVGSDKDAVENETICPQTCVIVKTEDNDIEESSSEDSSSDRTVEAKAEAELAQDKLSEDPNVSLREDKKSILTDSIEDGLHAKLGQESNVEVKVEEVPQNEHFTETEESVCVSHESAEKYALFQTLTYDLDPEEQMEVATQLGSLNFETDSMVFSDKDVVENETICPQTCVIVKTEKTEDNIEKSSSEDSSSDRTNYDSYGVCNQNYLDLVVRAGTKD